MQYCFGYSGPCFWVSASGKKIRDWQLREFLCLSGRVWISVRLISAVWSVRLRIRSFTGVIKKRGRSENKRGEEVLGLLGHHIFHEEEKRIHLSTAKALVKLAEFAHSRQ